jgi:RimJ/RimL family protein N-acetyltransferase
MAELVVRALIQADAPGYRALMLRAYEAHPMEFTSTPAERASQPLAWWEKRIGDGAGSTAAFGAFVNAELAGAVALSFETREKARHKADLIGMYVSPAARGMGAGRALVHAVLGAARARPGVRQVLLTVTEGNLPAESLYAACGFECFGVEPRAVFADGAFRGKVHMWCDLSTDCHPEQSEGSHPAVE